MIDAWRARGRETPLPLVSSFTISLPLPSPTRVPPLCPYSRTATMQSQLRSQASKSVISMHLAAAAKAQEGRRARAANESSILLELVVLSVSLFLRGQRRGDRSEKLLLAARSGRS